MDIVIRYINFFIEICDMVMRLTRWGIVPILALIVIFAFTRAIWGFVGNRVQQRREKRTRIARGGHTQCRGHHNT